MATRATLTTRVQGNLGGRTDKDTQIVDAFNDCLRDMCLRHRFRDAWSETDSSTLVLDATSVAVPTDTFILREARYVDTANTSWPINILIKDEFVRTVPDVAKLTSSKPVWAYIEGTTFHYGPPSEAVGVIRFTHFNLPTLPTVGTSNPIRGSDHILVAFATSQIFDHMQNPEDGNIWRLRYERTLKELIRADSSLQAEKPQLREFQVAERQFLVPEPWLNPFVFSVHPS